MVVDAGFMVVAQHEEVLEGLQVRDVEGEFRVDSVDFQAVVSRVTFPDYTAWDYIRDGGNYLLGGCFIGS